MRNILITFLLLFSILQFNCSNSKYFTPVSSVRRDPQQQITDFEIQKAFQTKPQLVKPVNIALYGGGSNIKGLVDSLKKIDQVKDVFEISPGIIEGDNYYQRRSDRWFNDFVQPESINLSQLRLVAAQGKCDMIVYCGISHKYKTEPNFLSYSYILLLPALFVPGQNAELTTTVDLFCIDVRNGFLYGTYTDEEIFREKYVTLQFDNKLDALKDAQVAKIVPRMVNYVKELLSRDDIYLKQN